MEKVNVGEILKVVVYPHGEFKGLARQGTVVHIFPKYVKPNRENMLKYYGPKCPKPTAVMRDRAVVEYEPGEYFIVPVPNQNETQSWRQTITRIVGEIEIYEE